MKFAVLGFLLNEYRLDIPSGLALSNNFFAPFFRATEHQQNTSSILLG
jgi:hypothetical protein